LDFIYFHLIFFAPTYICMDGDISYSWKQCNAVAVQSAGSH